MPAHDKLPASPSRSKTYNIQFLVATDLLMRDPREVSFLGDDLQKDSSRSTQPRRRGRPATRTDLGRDAPMDRDLSQLPSYSGHSGHDMDLFVLPESSTEHQRSSTPNWALPAPNIHHLGDDNWGLPLLPSSTLAPLPDLASFNTSNFTTPSMHSANSSQRSASILPDLDDWTLPLPGLSDSSFGTSQQQQQRPHSRQAHTPLSTSSFSFTGSLPELPSLVGEPSEFFDSYRGQSRDMALSNSYGRPVSAPEYVDSLPSMSRSSDATFRYQGYAGDAPLYSNPDISAQQTYVPRRRQEPFSVVPEHTPRYNSAPAGRSTVALPVESEEFFRRSSMPNENRLSSASSLRPSTRGSGPGGFSRRMGTVTSQNMQGLYTRESIDRSFPGEWGDGQYLAPFFLGFIILTRTSFTAFR